MQQVSLSNVLTTGLCVHIYIYMSITSRPGHGHRTYIVYNINILFIVFENCILTRFFFMYVFFFEYLEKKKM